jgi:hypothetical protein
MSNPEQLTVIDIDTLMQGYAIPESISPSEVISQGVLEEWQDTLGALKTDPSQLIGKVEWITKLNQINNGEDK